MEIFYIVLRCFMVAAAAIVALVYAGMQFWQRVPSLGFKITPYDSISYGFVGFLFGVGFNSSWALLSFLPLVLLKFLSTRSIQKNRLRGSGRWMEVQWHKLTPKGFNIPKHLASELQRLPGDTHFIVPRIASLFAIKYFTKSMRKNANKVPNTLPGQEAQAFEMVEKMANNIRRLDSGKTEQVSLPFGVLKVTRL